MHTNDNHRVYWNIIELKINHEKQIVQINDKIAKHFEELTSISLHIIPATDLNHNFNNCGDLSLSINNMRETILHTSISYNKRALSTKCQGKTINAKLQAHSRINGYYRDFGQLKDENQRFIPYTIKLIMQCKQENKHE